MKTKRISERRFEAMLGSLIARRVKNVKVLQVQGEGLVVCLPNGQTFQVTTVESNC